MVAHRDVVGGRGRRRSTAATISAAPVVSILAQKGGVGKTSIALALAVEASADGRTPPCSVEGRVVRWSEAESDIRATRRWALDGPMGVVESDRPLLEASLAVCHIVHDDAGNRRLVKGSNNTARDDVVAAWMLAVGGADREPPACEYNGMIFG